MNKYINQPCSVIMTDGTYPATVTEYDNKEESYVIKLDDCVFSMRVNKPTVEDRIDYLEFQPHYKAEFYAC